MVTNRKRRTQTAEQAEEEFPVFQQPVKWTLISDKLIKENNLQVTQEELKEAENRGNAVFGSMSLGDDTSWLDSYVDRMMKDEKQVDASYRRLVTEKLFGFAQTQVTPAEKK